MINSTLLDVRGDNKRRLEPELKLEEVWIYAEDDEQVVCIEANLLPEDKGQLVCLIK